MALRIFRPLCFSYFRNIQLMTGGIRTFLSPSYYCNDKWKNLAFVYPKTQFSLSDEFVFISNNLANDEKAETVSHIDFDQLVHRLAEMDITSIEYFENIMLMFQKCQASILKLNSTHHAIIRAYINLGQAERLLTLLNKKAEYGLFLDFATANFLMSHFLKNQQVDNCFATLFDLVCQEDLSDSLNVALGLLCCSQKLQQLFKAGRFETFAVPLDMSEEIPVAVDFIRNPNYDDHFDVICPKLRLGKCLLALGRRLEEYNDSDIGLARACQLIGAVLYEKLDLLDQLTANINGIILPSDTLCFIDWGFDCVTQVLSDDEVRKPGHFPRWTESELAAYRARWNAQLNGDLRHRVQSHCQATSSKAGTLFSALQTFTDKWLSSTSQKQAEEKVVALYNEFHATRTSAWMSQSAHRLRLSTERKAKLALRALLDREEQLCYFEELKEVRERAWLAPRTREERSFSHEKEVARDLTNLSEQSRRTTVDYEPLNYT